MASKYWKLSSDKIYTAYWLQSPHYYQKDWYFKIAFKSLSGEIAYLTYPFSLISRFRLGSKYKNEKIVETVSDSNSDNNIKTGWIDISNDSGLSISDAYNSIGKDMYTLATSDNLEELCVKYKSDNKTVIIPCIEIVRSIFVPTRFFAGALTDIGGLQSIIDWELEQNKTISIHLNGKVRVNALNNNTAYHLVWLLKDSKAAFHWKMLNESFQNISKDNKKNLLSCTLPFDGTVSFRAKYIRYGNTFLVLEIIQGPEVEVPYTEIIYSHDHMLEINTKRHNITENESETEGTFEVQPYQPHTSDPPKNSERPEIYEDVPVTVLKQSKKTRIVRKRLPFGRDRVGPSESQEEGSDQRSKTKEPEKSEDNLLVFISGDTIPESFGELNKILKYLIDRKIEVQSCISKFPFTDRSIAKKGDDIRSYIIVKLKKDDHFPRYLLEIEDARELNVSSLFLGATNRDLSLEDLSEVVEKTLRGLADNNNHWDMKQLKEISSSNNILIKQFHHRSKSPENWAKKIIPKL